MTENVYIKSLLNPLGPQDEGYAEFKGAMQSISDKLLSGSMDDIMNNIMKGRFDLDMDACENNESVIEIQKKTQSNPSFTLEWPILKQKVCAHHIYFDPFVKDAINDRKNLWKKIDRSQFVNDEGRINAYKDNLGEICALVYECGSEKEDVVVSITSAGE